MVSSEASIEPIEVAGGVVWLGVCAVAPRAAEDERFASSRSNEEEAVAASISFRRGADEYVVSRWLAREVAGRLLGLEPGDVPLRAPRGAAPKLEASASVSLSHSNGLVVAAATRMGRVAVDVESEGPHLLATCRRFVPTPEPVVSVPEAAIAWVRWEAARKLGGPADRDLCRRFESRDGGRFALCVAVSLRP